ncbi:UNVERIFIED_CONTAM: hypothetical protein PYX00_009954 [Menopon gallinae]|uniref:Dual specificity protein phosphatase 19 n=1 Tax=Menopon gallinae TaxID=328185 RepID=A0AAW2HDE3_9NEOP
MSESSLLAQIKKRKTCLKPQETIITSAAGEKYVEKKSDDGEIITTKLKEESFGFVVDEKPDLQVAEILPYLLLSSQDVVQDSMLLKSNKVTHVLSVGVDLPQNSLLTDVVYKKISFPDLPEADLLGILNECFNFISNAKMECENNRVLVHCNAGYSRSPSVVIAYLMKTFGYSLEHSLNVVREKRMVRPNDGFIRQLKQYKEMLRNQCLEKS